MTRVATEENESYLLEIAEYGTAQHMESLVKAFRTVSRNCDVDGINAINNDSDDVYDKDNKRELNQQLLEQENRSVSCYQDDDGMWIIKARLPAEEGGLVAKVLKELGDQLAMKNIQAPIEKDEVTPVAKNEATPLVAAETAIENTPLNSAKSVSAETFPQRRADALVAIAEHYLPLQIVRQLTLQLM